MKILVLYYKIPFQKDENFDELKTFGKVEKISFSEFSEIKKKLLDAEIIFISSSFPINEKTLNLMPKLKFLGTLSTGYNHIDTKLCQQKKIIATNIPSYATNSTVQHTFAMLFYLLHHLKKYDRFTSSKTWCRSNTFSGLMWKFHELTNKTWGIIGMGRIGKKIASIAEKFGAKIIYYSTSGQNKKQKFQNVDLKNLLQKSDIISIHCPINEKTKNLIQIAEFKLMKKNCILLNMARGGIVNEKDWAKAMNDRLISASGTDVTSAEPPDIKNPLFQIRDQDNFLITPHVAWGSHEATENMMTESAKNLAAFLKHRKRNRLTC